MLKRMTLAAIALAFIATTGWAEVVALTETPVAEYTLPDGSVIKNAFVWRRSSEGVMIVHDDGQYFLNFQTLSDEWKIAYLGEGAVPKQEAAAAEPTIETSDPLSLSETLATIPTLNAAGRTYLLRADADETSKKDALALATLQSLLSGKTDAAKHFALIIEESEYEIESVDRDVLLVPCASCGGSGSLMTSCADCGGSKQCARCGGDGERDTGFKDRTVYCTTCKGSGECKTCGGAGGKFHRCNACAGLGERLEKDYCEIKRDQLARAANAAAVGAELGSITKADIERVKKTMRAIETLDRHAYEYYTAEEYDGAMDAEILSACVLSSLLRGNGADAERFYLMIQIHLPENETLDINKYLQRCETCDGKGSVDAVCRDCGGTGNCVRCGGDGQRETGFKDRTTHCTTCRGNGKCPTCAGTKQRRAKCSKCGGRGNVFKKERSKIKLDILIDALNNAAPKP